MKKVLMFTAIIVALCSCSKDDEPSKSIKIDNSKISLDVDDSKKLTIALNGVESSTIQWETSNDFIADVDANGNVEGIHVGTANVYAKSDNLIDSCLVEVIGKYNTFIEPYVTIGASKNEIKALEKRSLKSEKDDQLVYNDSNSKVELIMYSFENNKLTGAAVLLKLFVTDATELGKFYRERYNYIGESNGILMLTNGNVAVGIKVESIGIMIAYMEDTVSKSTKSSESLVNEYYEKLNSKLNSYK